MFHLLLVFLALVSSPVLSEVCNLCPDPAHTPQDESAKFSYFKNDEKIFVNCSYGYDLALQGEFSDCDALHGNTSAICQCGPPKDGPFQCSLCGDGIDLPSPTRVVADRTCTEWQEIASADFEMDCPSWQKSMGTYCGCNIASPGFFDGFCRLCNNTILPLANSTVTFVNGDVEFCAEIEQDINTASYGLDDTSCYNTQEKFKDACDCDYQFSYTKAPSPGPPSGAYMREISSVMKSFLTMSAAAVLVVIL